MIYVLLILGFFLLIKGADILVEGSTTLAKHFGISNIVIGLTVVAFGTSMPELIVNILSSVSGASGISIGNIVGSNIANILLILGASALITTIKVQKNTVWKEIPFSLLAVLILFILSNDNISDNNLLGTLSKNDGFILIFFFIIFLYYTYSISRSQKILLPNLEKKINLKKSVFYIMMGIVALFIGGKWVVDSAVQIAKLFNISETIIGISVVAIGTSLPELVTSIVAGFKKNSDIAIGNIVGSNIFNIFWVLGLSSIISPINIGADSLIDFKVLIIASVLLFIFLFLDKKNIRFRPDNFEINKVKGILFLIIYFVYLVIRFRG